MRIVKVALIIMLVFILGCKDPESELEKKLKSPDVEVRIEAAKALGERGTMKARNILYLHADDPDYRVKNEIQKAIKKIEGRPFYK